MLPVLFQFNFQTPMSQAFLYLLGLLAVVYFAWSGWRGAAGKHDPRSGKPAAPTRNERLTRALVYGGIAACVVRAGFFYALPPTAPFGNRGQGFPLHTYGLMLMLGFMSGVAVASRLARREWPGLEGKRRSEEILDLAVWVLLGGIVGSKILFLLVNWQDYAGHWGEVFEDFPWKALGLLGGGLVFYGGLLGAMAASWWFARKHRMPFLRLADLAIPAVSLGQAFGRLGCFSAGCCWGAPTGAQVPWGVSFPGAQAARDLFGRFSSVPSLSFSSTVADTRWVVESTGQITSHAVPGAVRVSQWVSAHGHTLPLHPTQLYESIGQLVLFAALIVARRYRRFHGQILAIWLMAYAVLRTTVELFRGDIERGTLHGLLQTLGAPVLAERVPLEAWYNVSTSQFISLCMFAAGLSLLVRRARRVHPLPAVSGAAPVGA